MEHQFRSIEQTCRIDSSCSEQLNLKTGCSGVNDKKKRKQNNCGTENDV